MHIDSVYCIRFGWILDLSCEPLLVGISNFKNGTPTWVCSKMDNRCDRPPQIIASLFPGKVWLSKPW